jgi:hypothetical protein
MSKFTRKGHVFTLDVIIAIVILSIGIALIFYAFPFKNQNYYFTEQLSENIMDVLANSYTTDFCKNPGTVTDCECPAYPELEPFVCYSNLYAKNGDLLTVMTEAIQVQYVDPDQSKDLIRKIFIQNHVLDKNRFGFALIYTTPDYDQPLDLYNTETDLSIH